MLVTKASVGLWVGKSPAKIVPGMPMMVAKAEGKVKVTYKGTWAKGMIQVNAHKKGHLQAIVHSPTLDTLCRWDGYTKYMKCLMCVDNVLSFFLSDLPLAAACEP